LISDPATDDSKSCHPTFIATEGATSAVQRMEGYAHIDAYRIAMQQSGLRESTIRPRIRNILRVARRRNIRNPSEITDYLSKVNWTENTKAKRIEDIAAFYQFEHISWTKPRCRRIERLPQVPLEADIDQLIKTVQKVRRGLKSAVFLQLLKETGVRPGEAWRLQWTDVDFDRALVNISPEKGSNPRQPKISQKLIGMLNMMDRSRPFIFQNKARDPLQGLDNFRRTFEHQRKRAAEMLENPKIRQITFKSLRHFRGTMEYQRYRDILHVMRVLGHKNIRNTLVYIHLISYETDEYICKVAATIEEAKELIEQGFDYVTEGEGLKLFRKRK